MDLFHFIDQFRDAIAGAVVASYPPLYDRAERERDRFALRRLGRRPLGGQADAIRAAALSLQRQPSTIVVGEMGTGKSFCAAAAAYLAGCRSILIVCPPHLVRKWEREVRLAVPGAQVAIARRIGDLERGRRYDRAFAATPGAGVAAPPRFTILSREQAKLGYRWRAAAIERLALPRVGAVLARDERGRPIKVLCCPRCGVPLADTEGVPLTRADLERKKLRCSGALTGRHPRRPEQVDPRKPGPHDRCNSPLWAADRTGPRRYPLADYIRARMRGHFDLVIGDEAHEYKARGSAQGIAFAAMVGATGRSLILTGTLLGGYSSTIFSLLYRVDPAIRAEFGFGDEQRWVQRYGIVERITTKEGADDDHGEDGRNSKRRSYRTRTIERPGISPAILLNLIGGTVFLRLADVATDLPGYEERVVLFDLDDTDIPTPGIAGADTDTNHAEERVTTSQARAYRALARELRAAVLDALQSGSKRLLGAYLQSLLAYPDGCTREEIVVDRGDGATGPRVIASAPALPTDRLYPKERALVELALRERGRGRRLLVYVSHTETRDLTPRLHAILEAAGLRATVWLLSTAGRSGSRRACGRASTP
jgi:hypothetical protein